MGKDKLLALVLALTGALAMWIEQASKIDNKIYQEEEASKEECHEEFNGVVVPSSRLNGGWTCALKCECEGGAG